MSNHAYIPAAFILLAGGFILLVAIASRRLRDRRERFIRGFTFPDIVREKIAARHPECNGRDVEHALEALREFFLECLRAPARRQVRMTSKAADDAWHEFILCTREYAGFCRKAFGRYLHHKPDSRAAASGGGDGSALAACAAFVSSGHTGCSGGHGCAASGCSGSCGGGGCSSS